jgi:hypothetical protein
MKGVPHIYSTCLKSFQRTQSGINLFVAPDGRWLGKYIPSAYGLIGVGFFGGVVVIFEKHPP